MSVLKTLTKMARALIPRDGSTRERSIQVHERIEGSVEQLDPARRLLTVRKAREQSSKRVFLVPEQCKITQQSESLRLEHINLYDHVWVVFYRNKKENRLEALDIEVIS